MQKAVLSHNVEKGDYDDKPADLLTVGRHIFCLNQLQLIAEAKVATRKANGLQADEVELYLGYLNRLREQLKLTSVPENMRDIDMSHITEPDQLDALKKVNDKEKSGFGDWILTWDALKAVLERKNPIEFAKLQEKISKDGDNIFNKKFNKFKEETMLENDKDAEQRLRVDAFADATAIFHARLRPMAEKLLGSEIFPVLSGEM